MPDQADKLRELIRSTSAAVAADTPLPSMVVVSGGKGGVGTTTVALNLAVAMVHGGRRTVLIDAAPNADVAHLANVNATEMACITEVVDGVCEITDALQDGPAGLLLLPGHWAPNVAPPRSSQAFRRLRQQLSKLDGLADVVVVDCGSGANDWTRSFWQESQLVLLVSTADDVAILDAYATLKGCFGNCSRFEDSHVPELRVLINQCNAGTTAADAERRLAAAGQRFLGCRIDRAPRLPRARFSASVWREPDSHFSRSVYQLRRSVTDVLAQTVAVTAFTDEHHSLELSKC